jgi:hypothetical protein
MPYISPARRDEVGWDPRNAGELNYLITSLILAYFEEHGGRYQQINDVLGALEGAKLEFYRRLAAPYEDTKIAENGDVY